MTEQKKCECEKPVVVLRDSSSGNLFHAGNDGCGLFMGYDTPPSISDVEKEPAHIEFERRHPPHMGEAGGYCLMCSAIDKIKYLPESNKAVIARVVEKIKEDAPVFYTKDGGTIHQVDKHGLPWDLQANGWYLVSPKLLDDLHAALTKDL